MTFITYIYDSFVKGINISKDRNAKYALYLFLLAMLCASLSVTLISNVKVSVFAILFFFVSMVIYFAMMSIIHVSILHFIISLFYKYKPKHSLRTFLTDMFFIHRIFIMLLPLSLFLSILPATAYRVFFLLAFSCLYVYYIYNFCIIINVNVKLESKTQAMFILIILYVVVNVTSLMLVASNAAIWVNVFSALVF